MLKIRLSYLNDKELNKFTRTLNNNYKIISQSKSYPNRNSDYKRIYIEAAERKRSNE